MENGKWVLSLQEGEIWHCTESFDSKIAAIRQGRECLENVARSVDINGYEADLFGKELELGDMVECFYVGKSRLFKPNIDADDIFERLGDDAFDEAGEVAEDYLWNVKEEERNELSVELTKVFNDWASKYKHEPHFWIVDDIEKVEVQDES